MTRSFKIFFSLSVLFLSGLLTGCASMVAVDAAIAKAIVASADQAGYRSGGYAPVTRQPINYAGQQYNQSQQQAAPAPQPATKLAPADECRRRHPGAATGGFWFGPNGELQCQTGTGQPLAAQPKPGAPGERIYYPQTPPVYGGSTLPHPVTGDPRFVGQQQPAPARAGGYECRFLRGQTCY